MSFCGREIKESLIHSKYIPIPADPASFKHKFAFNKYDFDN